MPKVELKVPKRSGFDKSHQVLLTSKCGTITPILVDELIPGSPVHLEDVLSASLPPLASDTFMRCNIKLEAFFVPTRLLYGGFCDWIVQNDVRVVKDTTDRDSKVTIPVVKVDDVADLVTWLGSGSLADYLGIRTVFTTQTEINEKFNIFPFLAYHKIYDDWYRNTQIQKPVFIPYTVGTQFTVLGNGAVRYLPSMIYAEDSSSSIVPLEYRLDSSLNDNVKLGELRQRNFGFDYFTGAFSSPQRGAAKRVAVSSEGVSGLGFTIAALRAANSAQQFAERNQLASPRYQDYLKANYNADLSSGVAQRTICLGSAEIPVYTKGIYQTAIYDGLNVSQNPFESSPAAEFGSAQASGKVELVKDFVAQEHGYLMVMATLVPVVTYSSGIDRMMMRYNAQNSQSDCATPILQNVGNQPIFMKELTGDTESGTGIFGYTDRYADFKQKFDSLHGLLRDGQSLQSFALQRSFGASSVQISSDFLQIPVDYLDQVAAVNQMMSDYGVWIDVFHSYKVSQPLAAYSIPSLQDPAYEHGESVNIEVGGSRL